jgi:hypothetical protein
VKTLSSKIELEHTDGILFSCTNAIETSAWFMINSTALGPVRHKKMLIKVIN